MNATLNFLPLASCGIKSGAQILVYGVANDTKPTYAVLAYGKVEVEGKQTDGWTVVSSGESKGDNLPTKGSVTLREGDGGVVRLMWRDTHSQTLYTLATTDGGKSFKAEASS